ncbi:vesicle coat component [Taxawa tesnikishii (nom. ined.)]|nr:vesicle coat component [Dothideales sp. JES 119]
MDSPGGPDFGYAWGGGGGGATWNPALRPEDDADLARRQSIASLAAAEATPAHTQATETADDDDFFDRYPDATPKRPQTYSHDVPYTIEPAPPSRMPNLEPQQETVRYLVDPFSTRTYAEAQDVEEDAAHADKTQAEANTFTAVSQAEHSDAPLEHQNVFTPTIESWELGETSPYHERQIHQLSDDAEDHSDPEVDPSTGEPFTQGDAVSENTNQAQAPETTKDIAALDGASHDQYEHQGDDTAADKAVDESPSAPLLEDEQPAPTPGWDTLESTHDGLGIWSAPEEPPIEEVPEAAEAPQTVPDAFDWGNDEGDAGFDEALGLGGKPSVNEQTSGATEGAEQDVTGGGIAASRATAISQVLNEATADAGIPLAGTSVTSTEEGSKEQDLAAMWQAALDDDDFLDDSNSLDPSAFFEDDGEGFLDDTETAPQALMSPTMPVPVRDAQGQIQGFTTLGQAQGQGVPASGVNRYQPPAPLQQQNMLSPPQNQYTLDSPQFFSGFQDRSPAGNTLSSAFGNYGQAPIAPAPPAPQQRPPGLQASQSFVDKAKGGYSSPTHGSTHPASTTKVEQHVQPSAGSTATPTCTDKYVDGDSVSSLIKSFEPTDADAECHEPPPAGPKDKSDFFADLPMVSKPRSRPSGAYAPGPGTAMPTPPPQQGPPSRPPSLPTPTQAPPMVGGLVQPERLPLLPEMTLAAQAPQMQQQPPAPSARYSPAAPALPSAANRFSPAPPAGPASTARYSPAPVGQAPASTQNRYGPAPGAPSIARQVQPFAPRTSSPLAYHEKTQPEGPAPPMRSSSYQPQPTQFSPSKRMPSLSAEVTAPVTQQPAGTYGHISTTTQQLLPTPSVTASPQSRKSQASRYSPLEARAPNVDFPPLGRPRTQSPGAVMKGPKAITQQNDRPISAMAPVEQPGPTNPQQETSKLALPHRRQFSSDLSFAIPQDERAADPLERWKGYPIFKFGANGTLITSFPKQAPFYAAGHAIPTIKCTAGSITIHDTKFMFPLDDRNAKFPGPLNGKGKGKKKDVLAWFTGKIEDLERANEGAFLDLGMPIALKTRTEEKVVLWKVVKILLENDNALAPGNKAVEEAVRKVLLPNLAQTHVAPPSDNSGLEAEPKNPGALSEIRRHLLEGERERAVWYATEQRLWSHALLISSTLESNVHKQVVQEFVRAQVKDSGEHAQSLAALYEIFAGNHDESIDELVPPSARAGFQMISKADTVGSSAKNPLEGLNQWRETLGLIISNRTRDDVKAIAALGKLLAGSRIAWCRPQESPLELGLDLDSIILTEIYEYMGSLNPTTGASPLIPHLQAYKLMHAHELAEHGLRTEALAYCDAIAAAVKSSTRASPYYHPTFTSCVDDLSRCLSQAPQTSSGSGWLSKPSVEKVSGSVWNKFNKFVAGDDSDRVSTGSGPGAEGADVAGPFAKVSGDSPAVSRSASTTDLYSAMTMNGGVANPALSSSVPGRYAPPAFPAAKPFSEQVSGGRPGTGHSASGMLGLQQRAMSTPYGAPIPQVPQTQPQAMSSLAPRPEAPRAASDYRVHASGVSTCVQPTRYIERLRTTYIFLRTACGYTIIRTFSILRTTGAPLELRAPQSSYEPSTSPFESPTSSLNEELAEPSLYAPPTATSSYEPPISSFDEPAAPSSYEPPTTASGYEPPTTSYQPYQPEPDAEEEDEAPKPKKKSFMDDDDEDDIMARAAALKGSKPATPASTSDKAAADRAADEAFRKAAEADAERDQQAAAQKKGWFGGWFKKDPNAAPGPVRAKLGEQSSFYYDPDLKKWVNKKGGPPSRSASGVSVGAMGPPSAPPSRAVSGMGGPPSRPPSTAGFATPMGGGSPALGPPSGPPSRVGTPGADGLAPPGVNAGMLGGGSGPPSAPPSRPTTSLSTASSIDDLLGAPQARKAGAAKKGKKGGRYVDVMAAK